MTVHLLGSLSGPRSAKSVGGALPIFAGVLSLCAFGLGFAEAVGWTEQLAATTRWTARASLAVFALHFLCAAVRAIEALAPRIAWARAHMVSMAVHLVALLALSHAKSAPLDMATLTVGLPAYVFVGLLAFPPRALRSDGAVARWVALIGLWYIWLIYTLIYGLGLSSEAPKWSAIIGFASCLVLASARLLAARNRRKANGAERAP